MYTHNRISMLEATSAGVCVELANAPAKKDAHRTHVCSVLGGMLDDDDEHSCIAFK